MSDDDELQEEVMRYGNAPECCPACRERFSGRCQFHREHPGITPPQLTNENINALLRSWERRRAEQDRERNSDLAKLESPRCADCQREREIEEDRYALDRSDA